MKTRMKKETDLEITEKFLKYFVAKVNRMEEERKRTRKIVLDLGERAVDAEEILAKVEAVLYMWHENEKLSGIMTDNIEYLLDWITTYVNDHDKNEIVNIKNRERVYYDTESEEREKGGND